MPRYFLNIWNSTGFTPDEEGQELAGADAARATALAGARSIMSEEVATGKLDLRGRIDVIDASGRNVLSVTFRDALEIFEGEPPAFRTGGETVD